MLPRSSQPVISFAEAAHLIAEHGSPLLVMSRRALRRQYADFQQALPGVELCYAVKALPELEVLRELKPLGAAADVCSASEVELARAAGFASEQLLHTHPCKTPREITACAASGTGWFTFDTADELTKLAQHAPAAQLVLRLAIPASGKAIDLSSRFGATAEEALALIAQAAALRAPLGGIAFHVGSQCLDAESFLPALGLAREIWDAAQRAGHQLSLLDIGGGFPVPYREPVPALKEFCQPIVAALHDHFGSIDCRIVAEPGRAMVAEAGTLVTQVIGKRRRGEAVCYTLDDGIYGSLACAHYDRLPLVFLTERTGDEQPSLLAGPTCAPHDLIARDYPLPELQVGDVLLVPSLGAYSTALSTQFNGLPSAQLVMCE